jgi:hypothetical protein
MFFEDGGATFEEVCFGSSSVEGGVVTLGAVSWIAGSGTGGATFEEASSEGSNSVDGGEVTLGERVFC